MFFNLFGAATGCRLIAAPVSDVGQLQYDPDDGLLLCYLSFRRFPMKHLACTLAVVLVLVTMTACSPGPPGPQGPPGPGGANIVTFRHTRTAANTCGPTGDLSTLDNPAINDKADALIFVTSIVGINSTRTNTNPNSNLLVIYTGSASFGTCPAGRWLIRGGDVTAGAQFIVMVINP